MKDEAIFNHQDRSTDVVLAEVVRYILNVFWPSVNGPLDSSDSSGSVATVFYMACFTGWG